MKLIKTNHDIDISINITIIKTYKKKIVFLRK